MARVLAILTLHTCRILEKISAQSTAHDAVKLLDNKFVPVLFLYFLFTLTHSAFAIQTKVERSSVVRLFGLQLDQPDSNRSMLTNLLKLKVSLILPTGSKANQASIMLGSLCWV